MSQPFTPKDEAARNQRQDIVRWLQLIADPDAQLAWAQSFANAGESHQIMVATAIKTDFLANFDPRGWGYDSLPGLSSEEFDALRSFADYFIQRLPLLADSWSELQHQLAWREITDKAQETIERLRWNNLSSVKR